MARHQALDQTIEQSYQESRCNYGSPRIAQDLARKGHEVSKSTVARRMKVLRIRAQRPGKYVLTTNSKHDYQVAPNLLDRDFHADQLAQKWVSDITYFRIGKRWYYLTVIIDLADRAVVGWAISDNMTAQHTTIQAFKNACMNRTPQKGMIFHSDRGVQYAAEEFVRLLDKKQCLQSMSRKGNCWDNAVAESFFKTIKTACIHKHDFVSEKHAWAHIFDYIDGWYNTQRIHSALEGKTPAEVFKILDNEKRAA